MNIILLYISIVLFCILYAIIAIYLAYTVYAMIKGAPFVPTKKKIVEKMVKLSGLQHDEIMMDLGSGDGRIVFAAANTGANCIGIEINPILYLKSVWKSKKSNCKNIEFKRVDFWNIDLSNVDVLTLFCIDHKMEKLKKKVFKEMKKGSRIVSYGFSFPDWQFTEKDDKIYLYIV